MSQGAGDIDVVIFDEDDAAPNGRDRRRDRGPKGRPLDDRAVSDIRALLGARPRRRDLLIEFLHLIQDKYRCISARHLRALAEEMRLSQAEVYEVASFYDHFDVVKEGDTVKVKLLGFDMPDSLSRGQDFLAILGELLHERDLLTTSPAGAITTRKPTVQANAADVRVPGPGGTETVEHFDGGSVTWVDGGMLAVI